MIDIKYKPLTAEFYPQVITLGNKVHGDGYLTIQTISQWTKKGITNLNNQEINSSFVALLNGKLIGFRITYAAQKWLIDQWCSPQLWHVAPEQCCYFKCNTVDEDYRGLGVGKKLLNLAIDAAKKQGAKAGVSHLWKQSPKNSAVAYFSHCGGKLITTHKDRWLEDSENGYCCVLCGYSCHCEAVEMIIHFD